MIVILSACVLTICYFDFRWMIIPNWLNLAVAASGILFQYQAGAQDLLFVLIFGGAVFCFFFLVRFMHTRLRGFVGLGLGDVKMFGAAAIWVSPVLFPLFLLLASSTALLFVLIAHLTKLTSRTRLAFGPFIGVSLVITVLVERQFPL